MSRVVKLEGASSRKELAGARALFWKELEGHSLVRPIPTTTSQRGELTGMKEVSPSSCLICFSVTVHAHVDYARASTGTYLESLVPVDLARSSLIGTRREA